MSPPEDWHAWHAEYDDPDSPLSRRLVEVKGRLRTALASASGPIRLLSLCAGDGRDVIPVVAESGREVEACLVELDPVLADRARQSAAAAGLEVDVRAGDAGDPATFADRLPVEVLLLSGVLGNLSDADAERTVAAAAAMTVPGGVVIWTRSCHFRAEPTHDYADPAEWVRDRFEAHGFETGAYVRPDGAAWRLGVAVLRAPSDEPLPGQLFSFVR